MPCRATWRYGGRYGGAASDALSRAGRPLRALLPALAIVLAIALVGPLLYLATALVLGIVPVNRHWQPTPSTQGGVVVWLRTNGIHADLVLPAVAPHDFTGTFARAALIDPHPLAPREAFGWLAFGWGDRGFFLHARGWADLAPGIALRALGGRSPSAMHVEYLQRPADFFATPLWLSAEEYDRLVAYILAGFALDASAGARRIEHPGHSATDAFYAGVGSYSLVLTSNEWVRRGLAQAGVRTAVWAPFDRALFWQVRAR